MKSCDPFAPKKRTAGDDKYDLPPKKTDEDDFDFEEFTFKPGNGTSQARRVRVAVCGRAAKVSARHLFFFLSQNHFWKARTRRGKGLKNGGRKKLWAPGSTKNKYLDRQTNNDRQGRALLKALEHQSFDDASPAYEQVRRRIHEKYGCYRTPRYLDCCLKRTRCSHQHHVELNGPSSLQDAALYPNVDGGLKVPNICKSGSNTFPL